MKVLYKETGTVSRKCMELYILLAQFNLVFQATILVLLLASIIFKRRGRFFLHGTLMLVAVILNLISFALIMGPSLISLEPVILRSISEKRAIVVVLHAIFGSVADILAILVVASWRFRPGTSYCIGKKSLMRMTFICWLIALLLGVLLYLLQYTDLFL